MAKIFHCADLHLDSPFTSLDPEKSRIMRRSVLSSFFRAVDTAAADGCDLMLIAGDMFDSDFATQKTLEAVVSKLASHPELSVAISPGNHDPYGKASFWSRAEFTPNVHLFTEDRLSYFSITSLDGERIDVYGYAFTSPSLERSPLAVTRPKDPSALNIVCAHADLYDPLKRKYAYIPPAEIARTGYDYIALGHIHTATEPEKAGDTWYAYSGSLCGRGWDETGDRGALEIDISKGDDGVSLRWRALPMAEYRFEKLVCDCAGAEIPGDITSAADKIAASLPDPAHTIVRLDLIGQISPSCELNEDMINELFSSCFGFELNDLTSPVYDCGKLKDDPTVRGAFFRALYPQLTSADEQIRRKAAAALRLGLSALSGEL